MNRFNVLLSSAFCFVATSAGAALGQGFGGYVAPVVPSPASAQSAEEPASNAGFAVSNGYAPAPSNFTQGAQLPQTNAPRIEGGAVAPRRNAVVPQNRSVAFVAQNSADSQTTQTPQTARREQIEQPTQIAQITQTAQTTQPAETPANVAQPSRAAAPNRDENSPQGGYLPDAQISNAIVPPPANYKPTETEQLKLDEFLQHWENFGKGIKRISCDVHVKEFDDGVLQKNTKTPITHTWGLFRFIAPNKLLYHVKGEFSYDGLAENGEPVWKDSQNEMKIVLDGKQFVHYDFGSKTAVVYPIAEEDQNIDLSMDNGQFPLFFIAKAELLKNRFYMRLVTPKTKQQSEVWIEAFPRYARDAEQFRSIIVILGLKDMQPTYMRKIGVNGKSKTDLIFENLTINKGKWTIEGTVDPSWTKDVREEKYSLIRRDAEASEYAAVRPSVGANPASATVSANAATPVAAPSVAANPNASTTATNAARY